MSFFSGYADRIESRDDRVLVELVFPHGNGLGEEVKSKVYADKFSKEYPTTIDIRHKRKKIVVHAYVKDNRVWLSVGPKYVQARKFNPYLIGGDGFQTSERQLIHDLRGSWYDKAYLRTEAPKKSQETVIIIR